MTILRRYAKFCTLLISSFVIGGCANLTLLDALNTLDEVGVHVLETLVPDEPQPTEKVSESYATPKSVHEEIRTISAGVWGDDHLFLLHPKYDAAGASKAHKAGDGLGLLDHTPGDSLTNLRVYLRNANVGFVRLHLLNTVCVRNKNCGKYEYVYGYSVSSLNKAILNRDAKVLNAVRERTRVYRDFFQSEFPTTPVYISPALEHNLEPAAWRILADTVWSEWSLWLVNNPMSGRGEKYKGITLLEDHTDGGYTAESDVVSTDGHEIMDMDSIKYSNTTLNKKFRFRWSRRNNCRSQGAFLDPRKRTDCLNGREAEQQAHVTDIVAPPPTKNFACSVSSFSGSIWKPLAEDKGTPDSRKNLPVIIPNKLSHGNVDLVDFNGKRAGTLGYYGKYSDGRPRSYSGYSPGSKLTGYEFQRRAESASGSSYLWAKRGGTCVGPFVPGRRQGSYR